MAPRLHKAAWPDPISDFVWWRSYCDFGKPCQYRWLARPAQTLFAGAIAAIWQRSPRRRRYSRLYQPDGGQYRARGDTGGQRHSTSRPSGGPQGNHCISAISAVAISPHSPRAAVSKLEEFRSATDSQLVQFHAFALGKTVDGFPAVTGFGRGAEQHAAGRSSFRRLQWPPQPLPAALGQANHPTAIDPIQYRYFKAGFLPATDKHRSKRAEQADWAAWLLQPSTRRPDCL